MRDERGSAGAIFLAGCWFVAVLGLAVAVDWGRVFLQREQMRTALDAAALAGALQVERRVGVRMERRVFRPSSDSKECLSEYDPKSQANSNCWTWIPYSDWGDDRKWINWENTKRSLCRNGCTSEIWYCWVVPKGSWESVRSVAESTFRGNARVTQWGDHVAGPVISYPSSASFGGSEVGWEQFKVTVSATLTVPMILSGGVGRDALTLGFKGPSEAALRPSSQPPGCRVPSVDETRGSGWR